MNFSSFSQRTTLQIFGTVTKISADVQTTGANYYLVELVPKPGEVAKLGNID